MNQGRTEWKTVFCVLKARMVYVYNADTPVSLFFFYFEVNFIFTLFLLKKNAKPIGSYNIMETETKHI